jgi:DNA-binding transcriptional MerR regulator
LSNEYFTGKELAKMFQVHPATIRREFDRGNLHGFLVGNELRCSQRDVDEYTGFLKYGKTSREITLEKVVDDLTNENERLKKLIRSIESTVREVRNAI